MSYNSEVFVSTLGEDYLKVGTYLQSETGNVYQVETVWPSIGGTTDPTFTLRHLMSGELWDWNFNEIRYHRLKTLQPEDVPMALLGAA